MGNLSIDFFVHHLHSTPIVRAAPFAMSMERLGFKVRILGVLPPGEEVYEPFRERFDYVTVEQLGRNSDAALRLAKKSDSHLVYAFKPFVTTLYPALIASGLGKNKPLILDIEDNDMGVATLNRFRRYLYRFRRIIKNPKGIFASSVHALRRMASVVTVSTDALQGYYGGHIVLNGPDEEVFTTNFSRSEASSARIRFGLPSDEILVLFAGGPSRHKGFDLIIDSVRRNGFHLVLAGDVNRKEFKDAKLALGERCHILGFVKNSDMCTLLQAVDIVPVPSRETEYSTCQLPAKLVEAMAMGKRIVVSDVGDLPRIIAGSTPSGRCGLCVRSGDVVDLANAMMHLSKDTEEVVCMRKNARAFFIEHASVSANTNAFMRIFNENRRIREALKIG